MTVEFRPVTISKHRRWTGRLILAIVLVVAVTATVVWYTRYRGSDLDRFYRPPFPFARRDPGELVKAEPTDSGDIDGKVWRIMYHSRSLIDEDIPVTGYVAVPPGPVPSGGRPVVSIGHPTAGIADRCAPSREPDGGANTVNQFLEQGWVVVATDYEGLGPPGRHPYLVGTSEGRSMVDAVRAARQMPATGAGPRYAVWGHSQGGHAALFARQVAQEWAPELRLVGAVAAGPVSDVTSFVSTTAFAGPAITLMAVAGYGAAYRELKPEQILTGKGLGHLDDVDDHCLGELGDEMGNPPVSEVRRRDPAQTQPWKRILAVNSAAVTRSEVPLLLLHGDADQIIGLAATVDLFSSLCAAREPVVVDIVPGADHGGVVSRTRTSVNRWLADRFANREAESDCRR